VDLINLASAPIWIFPIAFKLDFLGLLLIATPSLLLGFLIFFEIFDLAGFLTILLFMGLEEETFWLAEGSSSTLSLEAISPMGAMDLDLGLFELAGAVGGAGRLADRDLNDGVFLLANFFSCGFRRDFSTKFALIEDVDTVRFVPVGLILAFLSILGCLVVFFLRFNVFWPLFSALSNVVKLARQPPKSSAGLVFFLMRDSRAGLALGLSFLSVFFVRV